MKTGRTKYVQYNPSANAGEVLLDKRMPCNCEASKHALINNCLSCGRIVCEQERSGPCFTCNELVCTPKEQEQISRMSKTGCKLYNKLMGLGKEEKNLQEALSHRDRLIEYDQTVERRTKVIDDQSDYFQTDSNWISKKERVLLSKKKEELREAMHGRKKNVLTFDFGEKKVIEERPSSVRVDLDELFRPDTSIFQCQNPNDMDIPDSFMPVYEEEAPSKMSFQTPRDDTVPRMKHIRIQDRDLQEMSDEGVCLSLHQPHASLLVAGIKKHEGRDWYTNHRGRLWIHSAAKVPTAKEISEIEKVYKSVLGYCKFPETYPTGVLLGCVDVGDCLPQLEYRSQFPDGIIASPYVFICENPRELSMKFPMKGNKKICKYLICGLKLKKVVQIKCVISERAIENEQVRFCFKNKLAFV